MRTWPQWERGGLQTSHMDTLLTCHVRERARQKTPQRIVNLYVKFRTEGELTPNEEGGQFNDPAVVSNTHFEGE